MKGANEVVSGAVREKMAIAIALVKRFRLHSVLVEECLSARISLSVVLMNGHKTLRS